MLPVDMTSFITDSLVMEDALHGHSGVTTMDLNQFEQHLDIPSQNIPIHGQLVTY